MSTDSYFVPARLRDVQGPEPHRILGAGFLAAYREPTRTNYANNLRLYFAWCEGHGIPPLQAQRVHIELYARQLEEKDGLMLSTVANKIGTIGRFYHFAMIDRYIPENPCQFVRRPTVPRVSTTNSLSRSELLKVMDIAERTHPRDHALVCILGFNGLRIGEVTKMDISDMSRQKGYITLRVQREKNGETPLIPLAPRTSWAVEQATFGRTSGPLLLNREGHRLDKAGANRIVKRLCKEAEITKRITCHSFRHSFITLALDAGASVRDVQNSVGHRDSRQVAYYDRNKNSLARNSTHLVSAYVEGS